MIPPKEHDTVLVTGGNEIGLEGSLVCVDGTGARVAQACGFVAVVVAPPRFVSCLSHPQRRLFCAFYLFSTFRLLPGSDAILKDANDEFKIIDFIHLVKISPDS
jgi:hypothetical protein